MLEALVITVREGVEAALVLGIAVAVLRRKGLQRLNGALIAGALFAVAVAIVVAVIASHITFNEELTGGIAMLIGAALVISLVWWMWLAAPHLKREIETGIARATDRADDGGNALGLFVFSFGMVFREGVETAIFLTAAGFNTQGLGMWIGALAGLAIAIVFGVLFARGTLRIPLGPFFSMTSAVLILIAVQLLIGGLHELSEAQVLPSSRAEMALIGPLIKNELLLFTLTVALAAGYLLFGPGTRTAEKSEPVKSGPTARLARAARQSEASVRRAIAGVALLVVALLSMAFVRGSKIPAMAPATPLAAAGGTVAISSTGLADGHMHFYQVDLPEGPVRFFALKVGNEYRTCFDACRICGARGYFEGDGTVICRNCTSPITVRSLGNQGGCNPIPLTHVARGDSLVISVADVRAVLPQLNGK